MDASKLKPCALCESMMRESIISADQESVQGEVGIAHYRWRISCATCGEKNQTGLFVKYDDAVEAWNKQQEKIKSEKNE